MEFFSVDISADLFRSMIGDFTEQKVIGVNVSLGKVIVPVGEMKFVGADLINTETMRVKFQRVKSE